VEDRKTAHAAIPRTLVAKVERVSDGNTITALTSNGTKLRIRLLGNNGSPSFPSNREAPMSKGEEALQVIRVLMKEKASDVGLRFDEIPGGFRCTMRSETAVHRFRLAKKDLTDFRADKTGQKKIERRLEAELDCLRTKEQIKQAAAPLYPHQELTFGCYPRNEEVRVELNPPSSGAIYWATGPGELTALRKLLTEIKRAARRFSP